MHKRPLSFSVAFSAFAAAALLSGALVGAKAQIPDTRISLPSNYLNSVGTLFSDPTTNLLFGTYEGDGATNFGSVFSVNPHVGASSLQTVYTFSGGTDGGVPGGGVISDVSGNLYGTTTYGGTNNTGGIYELVKSGPSYTYKDVYDFTLTYPNLAMVGELKSDAYGNLYGTTVNGGTYGNGNVFEIQGAAGATPTYTDLYDFPTSPISGVSPSGGVTLVNNPGGSVTLYGALSQGGTYGYGDVYSLLVANPAAPSAVATDLYDFANNGTDGNGPVAAPLIAYGDLFGATSAGGIGSAGVLYEISDLNGTPTYQTLYGFTGGADGAYPLGTLVADGAYLLGTTSSGGTGSAGVAWSYNLGSGQLTPLISFDGGTTLGGNPQVGLTQIQPGVFAGVNISGGANGAGVLFIITPEPGSYATMLIGAVTFGGILARKRKKRA